MAGKFVDLNEAAKMIGVNSESLVEMRSKGTIFGYRDGASWKFKVDEVERIIREELLPEESIQAALHELDSWSQRPDAAIWYAISWAEGQVPLEQ